MRLFLAIALDEPVRAAVGREQARLAAAVRRGGDDGGLRLVREEQLHLTLVFLGEVDEGRATALVAELAPPIPVAPYTIGFGSVGVFPPRGNPRVLWLDVVAGAGETRRVHAALVERVSRVGAPIEDRAFTPHLTLGRWRDGRPRHRAAVEAAGAAATMVSAPVAVVTLYQSRLGSTGAQHTPVARTPLQCP